MNIFAIIPAAGRSRRMGQPKLLLPWQGATVIEQVIATWRASRATHVVVVVHPEDAAIADLARNAGATVVQPAVAPPQMKDSVAVALSYIAEHFDAAPHDAWLLAPADMPQLAVETINRLVDAYADSVAGGAPAKIIVPTHDGRRGHPVLFGWATADEVARLGDEQGIDTLLAGHPIVSLPLAGPRAADFDTPAEYDQLRRDT